MKTYWSSEVAGVLGISPNTLRKWSLALENAGYEFLRDGKQNRAYKDADIIAFRRLQECLNNKMSMDNAVMAVLSTYPRDESPSVTPSVLENQAENGLSMRSDERYPIGEDQFREYVQQQQEFQQALLEKLNERDAYIQETLRLLDERIKERDDRLLKTMNEVLETKRLLAAAKEEQPKQKKWYDTLRFWK